MKISGIFVLFTLNVIVNGWVTFLQPIAVSLGTAFAALNLDYELFTDAMSVFKIADPKNPT